MDSIPTRSDLVEGLLVQISTRNSTDYWIEGSILRILSEHRTKGVYVELTDGTRGYVQHIVSRFERETEIFAYYNAFLHTRSIEVLVWKNTEQPVQFQSTNGIRWIRLYSQSAVGKIAITQLPRGREMKLKKISRKSLLTEQFSAEIAPFFRINDERKIAWASLHEKEQYFHYHP